LGETLGWLLDWLTISSPAHESALHYPFSARDFRQHIETMDGGGDAEAAALVGWFKAHYRSLATRPTPFSTSDFGGKDKHHLKLAAFRQSRIGVDEYAVFAQVASFGTGGFPVLWLELHRHAGSGASPAPALAIGEWLCHGRRA